MKPSAWAVYILECGDGSLYTGATAEIERRIKQHNAGSGAKYTRQRRPVRLVYLEAASDRSEAFKREAAIKRLSRDAKQTLIAAQANASNDISNGEPA